MERPDELYLTIISDELHFLIPVFGVVKIMAGIEKETDLPVLDLVSLTGGAESPDASKYGILLSYEEKRMVLLAEEISDICSVEEKRMIKLKEPVLNNRNRYLYAVVPMEEDDTQGQSLAYILDPVVLYERAIDCSLALTDETERIPST